MNEANAKQQNGNVTKLQQHTAGAARLSQASVISYASQFSRVARRSSADTSSDDGKPVTDFFRNIMQKLCPERPRYFNRPLADKHDSNDETFIVITSRFGRPHVHRLNKAKSVYIFGQNHPVRKFALYITTNQYFETFVLVTILVNCVFLALTNPPEEPEYVFAAIYTIEMILKIISKGFALHKYAYLRDPWNWLDFVVVILGYITLAPGVLANLSGIRTFRVFRALRTISAVKGLKMMVNTLLVSMKMLWDVLILTMFFICIYALVGMQVFVGVLRNKCAEPVPDNLQTPYQEYASNQNVWIVNPDGHPTVCGNISGAMHCTANQSCLPDAGANPNYGFTSFDHFGWAIMTSFQLVTLDFWENVYNNIIFAMGPWTVIYFLSIVLFGRFYLINLVLAVVAASYENEVQNSKQDNDSLRFQQKQQGSTFSLRSRRSIMSLVYGEQDVVLNESIQRTMIDVAAYDKTRNSLALTQAESVSVFQINQSARESKQTKATDQTTENNNSGENRIKPVKKCCSCCGAGVFLKCGFWRPFRKGVRRIVEHKMFEAGIIVIILINTLFMSLQYHGMNEDLALAVDIVNLVCTFIFLMEMILKLIALKPSGYIKSRWNIFDGVVVIISLIDTVLTLSNLIDNTGTSVLRSFRLVRILKLAKSWSTMSSLLATIAHSLGALANLSVILAIIIYIFAVVGMQLFGSSYTADKFDGEVPRWRFTDFWHSFLLIFRIICGEWIEPLWDCMRAAGPAPIILFIPAFLLGHFIILNLFLALLLSSFDGQASLSSARGNKKNRILGRLKKVVIASSFIKRMKSKVWPAKTKDTQRDEVIETCNGGHAEAVSPVSKKASCVASPNAPPPRKLCCCSLNIREYEVDSCFPTIHSCCTRFDESTCHVIWIWVRYKVKCFVEHKYFEWFIVFLIAASSIALAFEDVHLDSRPTLKESLRVLNIFFAVVFVLEFILKLVGLGFTKYFSSAWNWLDVAIIVVSLIALFGNEEVMSIRSLRTLRALRPLRAISRFERMRVVISSLFHAIPGIANVLLVCLVFWLIFSIMGVNLFGGKFYKCVDARGVKYDVSVVPNKTVCLQRGDRWINSNVNFDNSGNGFLVLLQVATFEGWMEIMEDAIDATKVDQQPVRENNMAAYLYFIIFIISGSFFILNLFIGVIIDNFNHLKQQMEVCGSMHIFLTPNQRSWMNAIKNAAAIKPKKKVERPQNRYQAMVFDLVENRKFEIFIILVITVNMIVMMVHHYGQPPEVTQVLDARTSQMLNIIFTCIFIIEALLRIIALRWGYFLQRWNVFDFVIVLLSIVGIIVESLNKTGIIITPNFLRVIRVFRVGRLLRFFEKAKGIQRLMFSLVVSLPALFNVGAILLLIVFIYAIIGMSFFAHVKKTGVLNEVVNFETFLNSMLLIFRLMTAAGWNDVLEPLMIKPPDCDPNYKGLSNGNCGNGWIAVCYFSSFIVIIFLVLINMYVAVILENYNNVMEQEKIGITGEDVDLFYQHWKLYDPDGTQYIYYKDLSDFLHTLEGNLKIKKPNKAACALLNIPLYEDDKIFCLHLLQVLVKRVVAGYEDSNSEEFNMVMKRTEERFKTNFPAVSENRPTITTMDKNRQIVAARVITRGIRRHRERKRREAFRQSLGEARSSIDMGMITHLGETKSRVADLVLTEKRLSDSLPDLCKTSRQASREKYTVTINRAPLLDRDLFNRDVAFSQESPISASLKNKKVSEQTKNDET